MIATKDKPETLTVRVGIYTRKSVAAGVEQEFNSLDAQREAVEAYVTSHRGLGWNAVPEQYDDNGFSGSNVERPAFQRLMQDIAAGKIDVVCVYRMDRLSRSLLDFTRLTEFFKQHCVGFVSITESFDTTSPMGRMVLGMLATFAQFERESIAQRTSDKMKASRRRGMWTGGRPPLGYDVIDKKLVVNEDEAKRVRDIFAAFLELGAITSTVEELKLREWHTKTWENKNGDIVRGRDFTKCSLRGLLSNPIYLGKMRCGDELAEGAHESILDDQTWSSTSELLSGKVARPSRFEPKRRAGWDALLQGIAKCGVCGSTMSPHYTSREGKRYRYYVCQRRQKEGARACPESRVAANRLEGFVFDQLREIGRDPKLLAATLRADARVRDERKPELDAEAKRLVKHATKLTEERTSLVDAITSGGASSLMEDVAELDKLIEKANREEASARRELQALELAAIDPGELRDALSHLDPIWDELFPREQQRVFALLLERVEFNGTAGEVAITFWPNGPATLGTSKSTKQ